MAWQINLKLVSLTLLLLINFQLVCCDFYNDTIANLNALRKDRFIRGIQLQITHRQNIIFNYNIGQKNQKLQLIDNNTVFKIASLSKSFSSVALMQLVEQKKITLNQSISQLLGFEVANPYFPKTNITVEMLLSHQSSILDCDPNYINFLSLTGGAQTGKEVPLLKDLLGKGGKYYSDCLFSKEEPGTHFVYCNFNYGIAATIIEKVTGQRFDKYQSQHILKYLAANQTEVPTFTAWALKNFNNLATLYRGNNGSWVPTNDYYPSGVIPQRNLTDYQIGSNGVLFSPQAGLRASVTHLCNYMNMLAQKGLTKNGTRILAESSTQSIVRPWYQYHGRKGGDPGDYQAYGLGIFKSTFHKIDQIIQNQVVRGHLGDSYGLLSGYFFWEDYTFSYIFSGTLYGYENNTGTIYEKERLIVHEIVDTFYQAYKKNTTHSTIAFQ